MKIVYISQLPHCPIIIPKSTELTIPSWLISDLGLEVEFQLERRIPKSTELTRLSELRSDDLDDTWLRVVNDWIDEVDELLLASLEVIQ